MTAPDADFALEIARRTIAAEQLLTTTQDNLATTRGQVHSARLHIGTLVAELIDALPGDDARDASPALREYRRSTDYFSRSTVVHEDERTWDEIRAQALRR